MKLQTSQGQALRTSRPAVRGLPALSRRPVRVSAIAAPEKQSTPASLNGTSNWQPTSWRSKPVVQQPEYLDKQEVVKACEVGASSGPRPCAGKPVWVTEKSSPDERLDN